MSGKERAGTAWGHDREIVPVVARNVSTRTLAYVTDAAIGLLILPFNLAHLGTTAYGLWMLAASVTVYFSILDFGYGGALVRFVAEYRARRDAKGLNEILSTLFFVLVAVAAAAYAIAALIAFNLDLFFKLTPEQADTGRAILLIVAVNVALRMIFALYGSVIVGFQQYHLNSVTSIVTSLMVAVVNVIVLLAGYGVVALVAATTTVRLLAYAVYRLNAYQVFPGMQLRWRSVRLNRLREVSEFGAFMFLLDWAYKLNYSADVLVIGALIGAPAVALWTPAQRLADVTLRLTNQLSEAMFPLVVDSDAGRRAERLRRIFLQSTRLSLAMTLPIAGGLVCLARPLLTAWLGQTFADTAVVVQILAAVVVIRVGSSTASIVMKGAGLHRRLTLLITFMGIANIALSVALAGRLGLRGVAIGTLVPVGVIAIFGIFPMACRRVGVPLIRAVRQALWPALWPAPIMAGALLLTREQMPATLLALALQLALAATVYFGLFLVVAIDPAERHEYLRQLRKLLPRRPQLSVAT